MLSDDAISTGLSNRRSLGYGLPVIARPARPAPLPAGGPGQRGMKSPGTLTTIDSPGDRLLTPDDTIARVMAHRERLRDHAHRQPYGARSHRRPGRHGLPPQCAVERRIQRQRRRRRRSRSVGADGSRRDVARGKRAPSPAIRQFCRSGRSAEPGRRRRVAAQQAGRAIRSLRAHPVDRGPQSRGRARDLGCRSKSCTRISESRGRRRAALFP